MHRHLARACGILQADGYKGYAKLYAPEAGGGPRLREAACWARLRRDFHDEWDKTGSVIAREALDRIGALYDVERQITGKSADLRLAARQSNSAAKVAAFFDWSEQQLTKLPSKGDLAKAFRYGLSRRVAFSLFLTDGRVAIDTNPAERAQANGHRQKNWRRNADPRRDIDRDGQDEWIGAAGMLGSTPAPIPACLTRHIAGGDCKTFKACKRTAREDRLYHRLEQRKSPWGNRRAARHD